MEREVAILKATLDATIHIWRKHFRDQLPENISIEMFVKVNDETPEPEPEPKPEPEIDFEAIKKTLDTARTTNRLPVAWRGICQDLAEILSEMDHAERKTFQTACGMKYPTTNTIDQMVELWIYKNPKE